MTKREKYFFELGKSSSDGPLTFPTVAKTASDREFFIKGREEGKKAAEMALRSRLKEVKKDPEVIPPKTEKPAEGLKTPKTEDGGEKSGFKTAKNGNFPGSKTGDNRNFGDFKDKNELK